MADYKLSQLTEKTSLVDTDIMHIRTVGAIDQKITGENLIKKNILSKIANYTILDSDMHPIILMTTGATSKTAFLPTVADNTGVIVKLIKIDSAVGYAILDGEGTEKINNTLTWEVTEQYGYVEVISNGAEWFVLSKQGCIYEMWNVNNYSLTTSWVNKYSLTGLTAGVYKIEYFCIGRKITIASAAEVFVTIATAINIEDNSNYTITMSSNITGELCSVPLIKSFKRTFTGATTLYLNAKEVSGDGAIRNDLGADGYIRATRIG